MNTHRRRLAARVSAGAVLLLLLAGCADGGPAAKRHSQQTAATPLSGFATSADRRDGTVQATVDRFRGHVEPDIAVNPRNRSNLLGACQYEAGTRQRLPGTFVSFNGGRAWRDNGLLPLPSGYEQGADTTVGFSRSGTGYVAAQLWHGGNGYASRVKRGGVFLWETRNGGRSFSRPIRVYVGPGFQDHPWLAARSTSRGSVLDLAWTSRAGLMFTHSRPGSIDFSPPRILVPGGAPSTPVVATGPGSVVDVFFQEMRFPATGGKLQPIPTKLLEMTSFDGGSSFGAPRTVAKVTIAVGANGQQPPPLLAAAADPRSSASAVAIAAQDPKAGHPTIELWQSKSESGNWRGPSRPVTGADAALAQEQPRLVYANGNLYVSYFTISRQGTIHERLTHTPEARTKFTALALPGKAFRATGFIGDYQALAITGHVGYALWNSDKSGRLEIVEARFTASG